MVTEIKARTLPVVEVFGPTIQGEGALAGLPTMFVRLGYCDYRCEWCDSMFAVEPVEVKEHAERLTERDIRMRLAEAYEDTAIWVTLSGGNPAVHDCGALVAELHEVGYRVAVETQGSIWREWLRSVDHLVVSPKPPSSGMVSEKHTRQTRRFLDKAQTWVPRMRRSMKIVVFDEADLEWARQQVMATVYDMSWWDTFLSVGTDRPEDITPKVLANAVVREQVCDRYRWLCERVADDPVFATTRVLPQLHVLAWGHARGV